MTAGIILYVFLVGYENWYWRAIVSAVTPAGHGLLSWFIIVTEAIRQNLSLPFAFVVTCAFTAPWG
jgi:hypothetical protein